MKITITVLCLWFGFMCSPTLQKEIPAGESSEGGEFKLMYRLFDECIKKDFMTCIKTKAITFFDRASRKEEIPVIPDFVVLKRTAQFSVDDKKNPPITEAELESGMPRNLEERSNRLDELLVDRMSKFLQTHSLQFQFPWNYFSESYGQGRGNKGLKKIGPAILLGALMKAGTIKAIAIGSLALLAGKALLLSKIALVLASIIGLKKLTKNDHDVVSVGHGGGGHYRRSIHEQNNGEYDPQELAYSGQYYPRPEEMYAPYQYQ